MKTLVLIIKSHLCSLRCKSLLHEISILLVLLVLMVPVRNIRAADSADSKLKTGLEVLLSDSLHLIESKSIAILTNHTGISSAGVQNIKLLQNNSSVNLKIILSPEHGFYGESAAGEIIDYQQDGRQSYQIISLYGKTRKPTPEMLDGIDLLIYDIQDIGARFYTYISTMGLAMEAAAEAKIPFMVLDRPNPVGGSLIEGSVLDLDYQSFIGYYPIPIRYAMTSGELAQAIVGEKWIDSIPELIVIPMRNWSRSTINDSTATKWLNPSPNIPDLETAILYLGTCLIEGTNLSEGRGTDHPFKWIGAPWINNEELSVRMAQLALPGVEFKPVYFTPQAISGVAPNPKYQGELCQGIELHITDPWQFRPVKTGLTLLTVLLSQYPEEMKFIKSHLIKLLGSEVIFKQLTQGLGVKQILESQKVEIEKFQKIRKQYLIYLY